MHRAFSRQSSSTRRWAISFGIPLRSEQLGPSGVAIPGQNRATGDSNICVGECFGAEVCHHLDTPAENRALYLVSGRQPGKIVEREQSGLTMQRREKTVVPGQSGAALFQFFRIQMIKRRDII